MKVYVDNYKKVSSWIWDFDKEKGEFCLKINFSSLDWDEPLNLLSLAYHDKQVRKEVCEEITEELLDISHEYWKTFLKNGVQYMTSNDLYELLKEITKRIQKK
ncbi:hypothetical protein IJE86_08040 [bacterium]|nr:hypothetical protein [bacterium]